MAQKTIPGNLELAKQIKNRRNELGLTIEEAASRAGVGTKTWYRYEAGEAIRSDKCKGICKALNWYMFPDQDSTDNDYISLQDYKNHEAWSSFLEDTFGDVAAFSFAVGSDILYDHIDEDISELASMPSGSHIGQLDISYLRDCLPDQFLMHYNYDFLYRMKCALCEMRTRAKNGLPMTAHSVIEELILYLCSEDAFVLIELSNGVKELKTDDITDFKEWVFDLFDDTDIILFLYSNMYLSTDNSYHFSHWFDKLFYMG